MVQNKCHILKISEYIFIDFTLGNSKVSVGYKKRYL